MVLFLYQKECTMVVKFSPNISCYDEKKQKFRNIELFSPAIYDQEHHAIPYSNKWEVYDDPDRKTRR